MIVGQGADPSDAGEIWHMFDQAAIPLKNKYRSANVWI
jgi:hypothetical protein